MIYNLLQLIGGLILTFGYIPQILQIIKTKSVKDLNLNTWVMVFVGILFMEIYALHLALAQSAGMMFLVTNSMSLVLSGLIVGLIMCYKRR